MPEFFAAASLWLSSVAVSAAGITLTWGQVVLFAAVSAYTVSQQARMKRQAKSAFNASQVDREANLDAAVDTRHLVLGRVKKGGTVFFRGSTGQFKETFVMALELAFHECDAIETLYLNGVAVDLAPDGTGAYVVTSEPYTNKQKSSGLTYANASGQFTLPSTWVPGSISASLIDTSYQNAEGASSVQVPFTMTGANSGTTSPNAYVNFQFTSGEPAVKLWWHLGGPGQTADARLKALFPDQWTDAHKAQGVCYIVLQFHYSDVAFPSGLPSVNVVMRGAKLYDPRTGTTAWSMNPALQARFIYQHPQFGQATISPTEEARFAAAASACDTAHVYSLNGVPQPARPLFQSSVVIPFGTTGKEAIDDVVQAMGGTWAFAAGEMFIKAGVYSPPIKTLGDSDLAVRQRKGKSESASGIGISPHRERVKKFNVVATTIWDETQDWKQVPLEPLIGPGLVTRDAGKLVQSVTMPAVTYPPQALHIAGIMMRDARDPMTVQLPFKMSAYEVELLDCVTLTIRRYGWQAGKVFQVQDRNWTADGRIVLQLKETAAQIFQPDADFIAKGYADNTALPRPGQIPILGPLTVQSGTSQLIVMGDGTIIPRVLVSWPAINDVRLTQGGQVEVQYLKANSSSTWESVLVPGDQTQAYCYNGIEDLQFYAFRARIKLATSVGDWSVQAYHTVLGKSEPPNDVTGLMWTPGTLGVQFMWNADDEPDYKETEIRIGAASQNWDTPGLLYLRSTGSQAVLMAPQSGNYRAFARHRDTSGNISEHVATVDFTVTAAQSLAWTNIVGRPKIFRVVAAGFNVPTPVGQGLRDAETGTLLVGSVRSYIFARIRRSDGVVTFSSGYDVFGGGAATGGLGAPELAAQLNATGNDSIAVVYTADEPQSYRLTPALYQAMLRCGASKGVFGSPQFKIRSAYCLVGIGGCGEGNGFEAYQGSIDGDPAGLVDIAFQVQYGQLLVTGMGATPRTLADYSYVGDLNATNGATFGVNIQGTASTADIAPGAVCDVLPLEINGPVNILGATEVARINVGPYPFNCQVTVTVTALANLSPTTGGAIQRAWALAVFGGNLAGSSQTQYQSPIVTDLQPASFGVTLSTTLTYFAGQTGMFVNLVMAGQGVLAGATASQIKMRVEVIKR